MPRHEYDAPAYSEEQGMLRQTFQGVTVTWTEDDAGSILLQVQLSPTSPPPVMITLGGVTLHDSLPDEEERARREAARRPELERHAKRRAVLRDMTSKLKPNATHSEIVEAALEAAEKQVRG